MTTGLLASKLHFPSHRRDFVPRQHLIDSLDAGLNGKLTLVSAPAGFGKTTMVSEWIRYKGYPTAWLSLDKNDNDLNRFMIYLVAALQRIDSGFGIDIQAALEVSLAPHFETLLTKLIGEIEKLPDKSILVLDDYHLIQAKTIHDAINFLIEYLPSTIHLVISGRTDPPLPISRLRVRGEVNEVRTPKLRFTKNEVATFLNELMGFDLPPDILAALETRTEGWIASLKLAALSMQGRDDWPKFIAEFSGSHRYVIDFLVDEVMARQPEEIQTFLRRTSILERFCAPLCSYVVGIEGDEPDIIGYLDRSNLFLIPLDDHRQWYRYHHLFADFLNQRLIETERNTIPELHRRASQWFKNEGLVDEAIQHALAGQDLESAVLLVDQVAADLLVRRESNKLLKLIAQLPPDRCQDYPVLCICHAWALVFLGQLDAVEPILQKVEAKHGNTMETHIAGYITTVRAYLSNLEGDFQRSITLTERAIAEMAHAPPDRITQIFQGSAVIWLGLNHRFLGNLDQARQLFLEAAELNQKAGNIYAALASYEQMAKLAITRGQLNQALEIFQNGLSVAHDWMSKKGKPQGTLIAAAGLHMGLGTVLYQLNDLAGADTHIQRGADLLELGELWSSMHPYRMLAYLRQAQQDFEAAYEFLCKAYAIQDSILVRESFTADLPSLVQLSILLSRACPEMSHLLPEAQARIKKLGIHANDPVDFTKPGDYSRELMYLNLVYLLIASNRAAEALPLLDRLLEATIAMKRRGDEIRYKVLTALAHHSLGETQTALDYIDQALTLAAPQHYVRLFVDEGTPMAELLNLALSQNIAPAYTSKLLAAFAEEVEAAAQFNLEPTINSQNLVEPLSQREIEVLDLIAGGFKYHEIAENLVVSINTVRHHTRNIYGKLNVNNRTQAISKAKELNLL